MQNYGGISRYYANLYEAFNSREDTACRISLLYSENYFVEKINQPQHLKFAKPLFGKSKSRIARWNKRYNSLALPLTKCDIFHPTYYDPYYINKVNQPVVITVHDMIYERMPQFFPDSDKIITHKKQVAERADAIICISESTKIDLLSFLSLDESKVHVVHHGLFNVSDDENIHLQNGCYSNYVLFVGERKTYKNFVNFIKGLKNLLLKDASLQVICAGGGPFTDKERELLRSFKISGQCHQVTPDDAQLKQLYRNALAFIFPSIYEGFGLPILESFDAECPVIMSDLEVFHEVGGNAALYFNPESAEDIEDKIATVLGSTEKQSSMKISGKERLNHFSSDLCIDKTVQVYKSLL